MLTTNQIRDIIITHTTDGPVTSFVIISRGCELVASHPSLAEDIANVVYEELELDDQKTIRPSSEMPDSDDTQEFWRETIADQDSDDLEARI